MREFMRDAADLAAYLTNLHNTVKAQQKGLRRLNRKLQRRDEYIAQLENELYVLEEQAHELGVYVARIDDPAHEGAMG